MSTPATELINLIPPHLDPFRVRWMATLSTTTLQTLLRAQCAMDRAARRASDPVEAQAIQYVLRERGPIEERLRYAHSVEAEARREHDKARRAADAVWERVEAAQVARLRLEQLEEEQRA